MDNRWRNYWDNHPFYSGLEELLEILPRDSRVIADADSEFSTMTSRPAVPESETPETDAAWKAQKFTKIGSVDLSEALDVSRSLERRLSLAQARIAGLEKVLQLYQGGRRGWEKEGMLAGEWLKIQAQFDAAVTEALKDRA